MVRPLPVEINEILDIRAEILKRQLQHGLLTILLPVAAIDVLDTVDGPLTGTATTSGGGRPPGGPSVGRLPHPSRGRPA